MGDYLRSLADDAAERMFANNTFESEFILKAIEEAVAWARSETRDDIEHERSAVRQRLIDAETCIGKMTGAIEGLPLDEAYAALSEYDRKWRHG